LKGYLKIHFWVFTRGLIGGGSEREGKGKVEIGGEHGAVMNLSGEKEPVGSVLRAVLPMEIFLQCWGSQLASSLQTWIVNFIGLNTKGNREMNITSKGASIYLEEGH
jgi:hypothetical protein